MIIKYFNGPGDIIEYDHDTQPVYDREEDSFATTSDNSISLYHGSESILFNLTPIEYQVLCFSIITMNKNFLIDNDKRWKKYLFNYIKHFGYKGTQNDRAVSKNLSELTRKSAMIKLKFGPKAYMVNPLFFSKRGQDRKSAVKFLLEIKSLPWPETSKFQKSLWNYKNKNLESPMGFQLSSFHYNREKEDLANLKFNKEFDIPFSKKKKDQLPPLFRN